MNHSRYLFFIAAGVLGACGAISAQPSAAAKSQPTGFPWTNESLRYTITYTSGLPIGDASISAQKIGDTFSNWSFQASVNAGVPGFAINDRMHSTVVQGMCSTELVRDFNHAGKKTSEKTTFDQKAHSAERLTLIPDGGEKPGRSTIEIPTCARDALSFLYYARVELGQGHVVPQQKVFFGSAYDVKMEYVGEQKIMVEKKQSSTYHVVYTVRGPKSDFHFDVFYAEDAAWTPIQIRIPLPVGTFTLDLVR